MINLTLNKNIISNYETKLKNLDRPKNISAKDKHDSLVTVCDTLGITYQPGFFGARLKISTTSELSKPENQQLLYNHIIYLHTLINFKQTNDNEWTIVHDNLSDHTKDIILQLNPDLKDTPN